MKKFITVLLIAMMCLSLTACGGNDANQAANTQEDAVQNESGREAATEFAYEIVEGEEIVVESLIFNEDVTVSGSEGRVNFINCEFNGDITNNGEGGAIVYFDGDCVVNGTCYIDNDIQESTLEASFPKYFTDIPLNVVCEDNYGSVIIFGDMDITFNGEAYSMADCQMFLDEDAGEYVPYEGQEPVYGYYWVAQWWENGEQIVYTAVE